MASQLALKKPERYQRLCSGVLSVYLEHKNLNDLEQCFFFFLEQCLLGISYVLFALYEEIKKYLEVSFEKIRSNK